LAKTNNRKRRGTPLPLPADEFRIRHAAEFEEDETYLLTRAIATLKAGPLNASEPLFVGEGAVFYNAFLASTGHRLMTELRNYWRIRLLVAAKEENSPDAYREVLESLLLSLHVGPPEGVLTRRRGTPGAPVKPKTKRIYETWLASEDKKDFQHLAFLVFGRDFTTAQPNQRKNYTEQCRQAVEGEKRRRGKETAR
jgi:hypothetical protein